MTTRNFKPSPGATRRPLPEGEGSRNPAFAARDNQRNVDKMLGQEPDLQLIRAQLARFRNSGKTSVLKPANAIVCIDRGASSYPRATDSVVP